MTRKRSILFLLSTNELQVNKFRKLINCIHQLYQYKGFHLSATVIGQQPRAQFNVAVTFDRRRISSCNCTCTSEAYWCSHVVAVCLHRIHWVFILFSIILL